MVTQGTDLLHVDWDDGNARKNEKHGVAQAEAEEAFFNQPLLMPEDLRHRDQEARFHALGQPSLKLVARVSAALVRVVPQLAGLATSPEIISLLVDQPTMRRENRPSTAAT